MVVEDGELKAYGAGLLSSVGELQASKGEYDKAIADYNEAIRLDPNDAAAYGGRGIAWRKEELRQGDRRLHRGDPARPEFGPDLPRPGRSWHAEGSTTRRSPITTRRSGSTPRMPRPTATGDRLAAKRSTTRRSPTTPRRSASTPRMPRTYRNRGNAWSGKGEHDQAIADCTEAIRLDPKTPWRTAIGAASGNRRGNTTRPSPTAPGDPARSRRMHWAYITGATPGIEGGYDKAIADYNEAIGSIPRMPRAYYYRGPRLERSGGARQGDRGFDRGDPARSQVLPGVQQPGQRLDMEKAEYDKALADWNAAIRLDQHACPRPYNNRAAGWVKKGDFDKAVTTSTRRAVGSIPRRQSVQKPGRSPARAGRFRRGPCRLQ